MPQFNDLPVDVLPIILRHIVRPQHIAFACRVNKTFYSFAAPHLYERAFIYAWQRQAKVKVMNLFRTLAKCPHLARHVQKLGWSRHISVPDLCKTVCIELRDFPKVLPASHRVELQDHCLKGIGNCVKLRSCTWTRDGSLNDVILQALQHCPNLTELEINGHSTGHYDPKNLTTFNSLRKISLIMPSSEVISRLPEWIHNTGKSLRAFTLICKSSPLVTDDLLEQLAPSLVYLKELSIVGCSRLTHIGIWALLSTNISGGITDLRLEGLSATFNTTEFTQFCKGTHALTRLTSVTLTIPLHRDLYEWFVDIEQLLWDSPLLYFHLYMAGGQVSNATDLDERFVRRFCGRHGDSLIRFAVLRLSISMDILDLICTSCVNLEQLFIAVKRRDMLLMGPKVSRAMKLRAIHITDAPGQMVERPIPTRDELISLVRQCGPTITQFGIQTRVWQVERMPAFLEDGQISTDIELGPYESPDVPDVFLVVRT